jgi:hypothetical protein
MKPPALRYVLAVYRVVYVDLYRSMYHGDIVNSKIFGTCVDYVHAVLIHRQSHVLSAATNGWNACADRLINPFFFQVGTMFGLCRLI